MRLIDADALIGNVFKNDISYKAFVSLVKRQPTIDAVPVRRGKWLHPEEGDEDYSLVGCSCSVCGWKFNLYEDDIDGAPYCAMCGARMEPVAPWYQVEGGKA